jgi:hypothetical protein
LRVSLGLDLLHERVVRRVLQYAERKGFDRDERRAWWTCAGLTLLLEAGEVVFEHLCEEHPESTDIDPLGRQIARWRKIVTARPRFLHRDADEAGERRRAA